MSHWDIYAVQVEHSPFSTMVLKSQLPTARTCYTLHLVFAIERISSLDREILVQMRGWSWWGLTPQSTCMLSGMPLACSSSAGVPQQGPHLAAVPHTHVLCP